MPSQRTVGLSRTWRWQTEAHEKEIRGGSPLDLRQENSDRPSHQVVKYLALYDDLWLRVHGSIHFPSRDETENRSKWVSTRFPDWCFRLATQQCDCIASCSHILTCLCGVLHAFPHFKPGLRPSGRPFFAVSDGYLTNAFEHRSAARMLNSVAFVLSIDTMG